MLPSINFKYTTTSIVHYPVPTTLQTQECPNNLANWIRAQDYVLIFLIPLNVITCAFFGVLYAARSVGSESVAQLGYALTFSFYAALVCTALAALRNCKRNEESSLIVAVLTTLRALGALAPLVLPEGYELLISQTVLDTWGNFLTIHLLTVLAREYFEDKPDVEQALSVSDSPVDESVPAVTSILTRENIFITAVLICSLATTILVVVPDWHNKPLVIAGFESSIWLSLILQFAVTLFVVFHIAPMVRGKSVGSVRARWVVLVVIIGGIIVRLLFDAAAHLNELALGSYVPFVTLNAFLVAWKETFTQAIPLAFHLMLVIDKSSEEKPKQRDAVTTVKQIFCAYLLAAHLAQVGLFLETTFLTFAQTFACVGILLLFTDVSLVLYKFVPALARRVQKDV